MVQYELLSGIDAGLLVGTLWLYAAYKGASMVYHAYFSPLSGIPGPWYAAISDIYTLVVAARLVQCNTIHSLFERYGPIVRIGPRRVVFCDRIAMKSVYCIHKFEKSTFYKALVADNHDHSMTSLSEVEHTARRKTFASHYAMGHIVGFQPHIHQCVARLIEVLDSNSHESMDCIHTLRHLLVDIIRCTVFGLGPVALDDLAHNVKNPICDAARDFFLRAISHSAIPSVAWSALAYLPHPRWQEIYRADNILASFVRQRLYELRAEAHLSSVDASPHDSPTPLMIRMVAQQLSGFKDALSDQDIVSECISHLVAGVDTSAATIGFMLWELSRRPDILQRLRDELDDVIPDRRAIPDYTTLAKQPYLTACLNEGFRMYGAVSALLERVVPGKDASGVCTDSFDILGFQLPPGTIVGTQAWSMHRDPDIFPCPELFHPERWLPSENSDFHDADRLARMSQYLMPFGAGTRACPGRYQAQLIFRATIAALVLNFDLSANPVETNADTMAPRDAFMVQPASRECRLMFSPRPQ
ncbi:cytochrome P450 [Dichomitus squalens]|uniref:Cytochrome P450 n=1 Tax=Dichomitus squalens TaxID=114155 RepID=A0A4Q9MNT5_9APHY|nr:cytochrome P450 [Dichomitus squalens]